MNFYENIKVNLKEASTKSNKYVDAYMELSYSMFDGMGDWSNWDDFADILASDYDIKFSSHQESGKVVAKGMAIMYERNPERFKEYVESLIIDNCINSGYFDYLDSKSHKEKHIVKNLQTLLEYLQNNGGSQEAIDGITNELEELSNVQTNARQIGEEFRRYLANHSFWEIMGGQCDYWTNKDLEGLPKEYACFVGGYFNFLIYDNWTKEDGTVNEYGLGYGFKNSGNIVIADLLTYMPRYVDFQQVGNSFEITPENKDKMFAKMQRTYRTVANELKKKNALPYKTFVKRWRKGKYGPESREDYNNEYAKLNIRESENTEDNKQKFIDYCKGKIKPLCSVKVHTKDLIEDFDEEEDKDKIITATIDLEYNDGSKELGGSKLWDILYQNGARLDSDGTIEIVSEWDGAGALNGAAEMDFKYISRKTYNDIIENWESWDMPERFEDSSSSLDESDNKKRNTKGVPMELYNNLKKSLKEDAVDRARAGTAMGGVAYDDYQVNFRQNNEDTPEEFIINKTPYGFTEVIYKGYAISNMYNGITVDIGGDEAYFNSVEEAIQEIDKLDNDPNYKYSDYSIDDEYDRLVKERDKIEGTSKDDFPVSKTSDIEEVKKALTESETEKPDDYLDEDMLEEFARPYYKWGEYDHRWTKKEMKDWIIDNKKDNPDTKIDLKHLNNLLDFQHDLYRADKKDGMFDEAEETEKPKDEIEHFNSDTILDELGSDYECVAAMYDKLGYDTDEEFFPEKIIEDVDNDYLYMKNGKFVLNKDGKTVICSGRANDNMPIVYTESEGQGSMGLLQKVLDKAEELGWSYSETNFVGDEVGYEFENYSPAGEDYIVDACCGAKDLPDDEKAKNLVEEIRTNAMNFDADEHIEMWIEARGNGVSGVPNTRELVEDADEIQKMLDEFADGVDSVINGANTTPIDESEAKKNFWTYLD